MGGAVSWVYIVRRDGWYAERLVWGVAGAVISTGTLLGWLVHPVFAAVITATGLFSLVTAFTGFCPISTALARRGVTARLGALTELGGHAIYRMRTDRWYLERGIYLVVGTTQTLGALLAVLWTPAWFGFTGFVGAMAIGFAWSGFCPVANALWWLGFEPRLDPDQAERDRNGTTSARNASTASTCAKWDAWSSHTSSASGISSDRA